MKDMKNGCRVLPRIWSGGRCVHKFTERRRAVPEALERLSGADKSVERVASGALLASSSARPISLDDENSQSRRQIESRSTRLAGVGTKPGRARAVLF